MPTRQEIIDYINQSATRRGIDPRVVLKVFQQESGLRPNAQNVTPREASYGIAQLNLKGGLGVEARRRGIEPTDPSQWKRHVDFSLDTVKRDGWRQWMGARDTGVSRWAGVNSISDTGRTKYPSVKMGNEPTLQNLTPPAKPTRTTPPGESAEASIIRQSSPTEESAMARPSVKDAIRKSMDEAGIKDNMQVAGFVPPGLTRGSAKTRAGANANVQPRGGLPVERDLGPEVGPYNRNAPGTRGMEGSYADYVKREQARMAAEKGGDTTLPPGVKSATDPAGAADPRTGTAVAPYDPTLAAQNDPARQALISARIRGQARGGGQPPPTINNGVSPRTAATVGAGGAIAASAAAPSVDPALKAVQDKINSSASATPTAPQGANVDPGVEERGRQLGARPGQMSDPNTGYQTMAAGPLIGQAMPVFQDVMRDPEGAAAVKVVAQKAIQAKARRDAQAADMKSDPTYYQQMAARNQQMPGGGGGGDPLADRAMERAVMMDRPSRTSPRQMPQQSAQPQGQTTRGTVGVRSTPQAVRDADRPITNEEVMPQPVPPGAEKGDIPQRTPVPPGFPIPPHAVSTSSVMPGPGSASPSMFPNQLPSAAYDPNSGVQGMPSSGQMPMDPVMMQLMQFFTGGGGGE